MKYNLTINLPKCYWPKKEGSQPNGQIPNIIGICSYCALDRPVVEWNQVLLHPELTPWWSFLFVDGAHHKKPPSPSDFRCVTWIWCYPNQLWKNPMLVRWHTVNTNYGTIPNQEPFFQSMTVQSLKGCSSWHWHQWKQQQKYDDSTPFDIS